MFTVPETTALATSERYDVLYTEISHVTEGERDRIANLANAASMLYHTLPDCNWIGFYLFDGTELVLGPFQGKPACIRIALGRGVCGTAAHQRHSVLVHDVETFPGHIACDAASRSELVVPLVHGDRLLGVLDLDSPTVGRFTADDQVGCERIARLLVERCDWV
jgi:L-methionine (R)-S-oxide reductase